MTKIRKNSKEYKMLIKNQDKLSKNDLFRARIEKLHNMLIMFNKKLKNL